MAKHKQKKRDRRDRAKLPKRIAGVKVPKSLRKGGGLRKIAGNPLVRDIVASALTAAAAAVASKPGKSGGKHDKSAAKPAAGGAVVAAFAAAATDVVRQLREGHAAKREAAADPASHPRSGPGAPPQDPPIHH